MVSDWSSDVCSCDRTGTATSDPFTPSQAGTYRWKASYSGDTNNAAIATACNDPGETSVVNRATPALTTVATATALVGGPISDTANLAGGAGTLSGTVTFTLYGPNDATCGNAAIFTNTKAVVSSGGGTGTATADPFTPSQAGTYRWRRRHSGATNTSATPSACNDPGETSVVNQATPTLTTTATAGVTIGQGTISDTANLAGGSGTLGGTITFTLYGPNDARLSYTASLTNNNAVVSSGGGTGT